MGEPASDVRTSIEKLQGKVPQFDGLPDAVRLAVLAATDYDVFPVSSSSDPFADQVLRARVVSFGPGAQLRFAATDAPFVVVFCQELKFSEIPTEASIGFVPIPTPHAPDQPPAAKGANGSGYKSNNKGKDGKGGGNGLDGQDGGTIELPAVYFLTNALSAPPNPSKLPYLTFELEGVPGGDGGNGGRGGDGGDGHRGRDSKDGYDPPRCKRQAASGGNGGNGGKGGAAGDAGNGGSGADLYFYAPEAVIDLLEFSDVKDDGGAGSDSPGTSGPSGSRGRGGKKGKRRGVCAHLPVPQGSWKDGKNGTTPPRTTPLVGAIGQDGDKGTVTAVDCPDINDLLTA